MLRTSPKIITFLLCSLFLLLSYLMYHNGNSSQSFTQTSHVDSGLLRDIVAQAVNSNPKVKLLEQPEEPTFQEAHIERQEKRTSEDKNSATTSSFGFTLTTTSPTTKTTESIRKESIEDIKNIQHEEEVQHKIVPPEDGFFDPSSVSSDLGLKFIATPIPKDLVDYVKQLKSPHKLPDCSVLRSKQNFVYIKTHKTASDTLSAMFRRFAYDRHLSVVLPIGMRYNIGWPYDLNKKYHRTSKTGGFNVLLDHSKYTEKYMREIMPADTMYITSWRETFSHLKSAMAYMSIRQWSGITEDPPDGMEVFLKNLKHYDDIYKILPPKNPFRTKYPCIPPDISMARNSMAADLGFPVGFPKGVYPDYSDNFTAIKEWLEHSNQVFSVVLLSDYFHHSLVMLKRMMCWSTKDILYERMNSWNTKYRPEYRKELVDNFRRWSAADYLAFELFNQTLWDRIEKWGHEDFMAELSQYEKTLSDTKAFCLKVENSSDNTESLEMPPTTWDSGFAVTKDDCGHLTHHMRDTIKEQYDKIPVEVQQPGPYGVPGC